MANVRMNFRALLMQDQEPPLAVVAPKKQQTAQGAVRLVQILMSRVDVYKEQPLNDQRSIA
jgi:hypothetical protein